MSDMLTHWAVFEDCRRLSQVDDRIDTFISKVIDKQRDIARLGSLSRAGSIFVPHILQQELANWEQDGKNGVDQARLAYALGGITHYPADVMMKPLITGRAQVDWHKEHVRMKREGPVMDSPAREVSAYYDTHVFRKVYLAGREEPFTQFLFAENDTEPGRALEEFIGSLFQRTLLSSHTLAPDKENLDDWLDNLLSRVQPLYINIRAFVDAFLSPDPRKMKQYGVEDAFYLESDPAIVIARKAQRGESITDGELTDALSPQANTSGYALAICLGMVRLVEASAFWTGQRETPPNIVQSQYKKTWATGKED